MLEDIETLVIFKREKPTIYPPYYISWVELGVVMSGLVS